MKTCGYCGRENDDGAVSCKECGTKFEVTMPSESRVATLPLSSRRRELNAWSATALLLIFLSAQFVFVIAVAIITAVRLHAQGSFSPDQFGIAGHAVLAMPMTPILVLFSGGIATILVGRALFSSSLKDTSPTGAAWVPGRWLNMIQGLATGLAIAVCVHLLNRVFHVHVHPRDVGLIREMAAGSELSQVIGAAIAVLVAPFTEEILFRGAVYGGYRKSFGACWAAVLTTALFCLLHFPQILLHTTALLSLLAVSVATLAARLRWGAVGPAIAVHAGYNTWIFTMTLLRHYAA